MAIRILSNGIQIGDYTLQETRDGLLFNGTVLAKTYYQVKNFQGLVEGHVSGGSVGTPTPGTTLTNVEKFPFAATTVVGATVFTLTNSVESHSGHHSDTHAYMVAGRSFSPPVPGYTYTTAIRKYPFAIPSAGAETNVGVIFSTIPATTQRAYHAGHSSSTWGFFSGGIIGSPLAAVNNIERFPFAYDNTSELTGSLTQSGMAGAALNSITHGYNAGRATAVPGSGVFSQFIDKFPFVGENNSSVVGSLIFARAWSSGGSSSQISGYITGGGTPPLTVTSNIQKFSFANETSQPSVGVLTQARWGVTNHSSLTDAYTSGGNIQPVGTVSPGQTTTIDKFSFGNDMDATAVGALTTARFMAAGHHF